MRLKLVLFSVILYVSLFAKKVDEGEIYFNNKQYLKAKTVYENLLCKKPKDPLYNYQYARCCYELRDVEPAIVHFEMSGLKYPIRDMYLGELYFKIYRFDESVSAYQNYLVSLDSTDLKRPDFLKKLKKSTNAARLITKVEDISIIDSIQTNKSEFLKYYKFNSELGSISQESLNMPHHRKSDRVKYLTQRRDRMYFSDSIQGQMNIFTSFKLLDGWSKPSSISDIINSAANENYPFLLLDGVTVYFASDGENSIGGYDLFVTRFNPSTNSYLTPENLGFPFNSPANDYMMVIDEQNKIGWFATDRNQPVGKVMIYEFVPNENRNIVRTENKEYLRNVAQLKTYRKAFGNNLERDLTANQNRIPQSENQIEFVLNDSTIYTNINQFRSPEALKRWNQFYKLNADYITKQKELSDLRINFENVETQFQRAVLAPQIIELEHKNIELKRLISDEIIEIRNVELKFLKLK
jgi:tetratricopeptide (TPR) repeat protein